MNILLGLLLAFGTACIQAGTFKVSILHTNDSHSWVMPRPAAFYEPNPARPIGGAAVLAAYVKGVKGPKLVLDAGDWFQGTPEGAVDDGLALAPILNAVGYDAMAPGNHEFDYGQKNLLAMTRALSAPVLCANVYRADGTRLPGLRPWLIKEVAGVKIGLFGLLIPRMKDLAFPEHIQGLAFRSPMEEAREVVAELRRQGATVVIALTHLGVEAPSGPAFEGDQTLAAGVPGIDLIVGGHSHTVLREPIRDATHGTLIVQAGSELTRVGLAVLEIDQDSKKVVSASARLVDLWPDEIGSDPGAAAAVGRLVDEVRRVYDAVIATAAVPLTRGGAGESSLGDWLTDCGRAWAGADLALQNGGGIRADIAAGPVTLRDLFGVMPFDNRMVKVTMRGRDVRGMLERGLGGARVAQISGAKISFRRQAPAGRRLESVSVAGKPLDDGALYTVATVDYLAKGGDGYAAFEFAEAKEFSKTLLRDVLAECARKQRLIQAPVPGRLTSSGG
ncbi:MAG: bifunctional UDP-sugar hydrolase/5'-nucleotidase [Elusimicrobia bacterium]|nr:bifunctional UDP-sugar hydrolase/5'-nucleotidase [Elusimicrobiota bacterium]